MTVYRYRAIGADGLDIAPSIYCQSSTDGNIIRHQIMLKSGAASPIAWFAEQIGPDPAGGNTTPYPSVEDVARLGFGCADGTTAFILIPAPVASIFMTDQETVDPTQIAGIIGAMTASGVGPSGSPVVAYRFGTRRHLTISR